MSESETKDEVEFEIEEEGQGQTPPEEKTLDKELDQYTEGVQKRINEEVAKRHAIERENQELKDNLNRAAGIARRAVEEVQSLRKRADDSDGHVIDNLVSSLEGNLELAKGKLRKAHEDNDANAIVEATAEVSSMAADLRRAQVAQAGRKMAPVQPGPDQGQGNPAPRQAEQPPVRRVHPKAQEWLERNKSWYGKDPERTKVAQAADAYVARGLGLDPSSDDYYKEVDNMVAAHFNRGTPGGQSRDQQPSASAVNPTGRSAPSGNTARKVTLTQSEVAQARRLGVSPEDYAKSKRAGGVVL